MTKKNNKVYLLYAGSVLRQLRRKTDLSIYKVAKEIHISGNYLSEIERGEKAPSDVILQLLSDFYGIKNGELFKLYNRLTTEEIKLYARYPHLQQIVTQISIDDRLSENEKSLIYNEIKKLYEKLINEK